MHRERTAALIKRGRGTAQGRTARSRSAERQEELPLRVQFVNDHPLHAKHDA